MRLVALLGVVACCGSAFADRVDDLIAAEMQRQHIPGLALAIVQDGKVVKEQGYGVANLEHDVPVTPETMFQTGSLGKPFTAALTLFLVDDEKFSLDDRISTHLPGTPESWSEITIRQLLTHTSGLVSFDDTIDLRRDYSDRELLASMAKLPLLFPPGEGWSYSNLGYQVLGMLCSKAGGAFYGDQLRERIFAPSGMKARVVADRSIVPHRAHGYDRVAGQFMNEEWVAPSQDATADGGVYASAHDLVRWSMALDTDDLLSREMKDASWSPARLKDGSATEYGFGWELRSVNGHRVIQHPGAWRGFSTQFARYPDDKLTIIVLTNRSRARPERIVERIAGFYIPDLKIGPPTKATLSATPAFVRGSMNGWQADRDRMIEVADGAFEVEIALEPGQHTFRIASEDWTAVDLGGPFDEPTLNLEQTTNMEWRGESLNVDVPQAATYLFRLDVRVDDEIYITVGRRVSEETARENSPGAVH